MVVPYITERQAKENWCPYARCLTFAGVPGRYKSMASYNRHYDEPVDKYSKCLGSKCAKWDAELLIQGRLTGKGRCGA